MAAMKATAGTLTKAQSSHPHQFLGIVEGDANSCYAKNLATSSGSFQCGGPCATYTYAVEMSASGERSYTVTNPNPTGKKGEDVTCGCSVVPSEYSHGSSSSSSASDNDNDSVNVSAFKVGGGSTSHTRTRSIDGQVISNEKHVAMGASVGSSTSSNCDLKASGTTYSFGKNIPFCKNDAAVGLDTCCDTCNQLLSCGYFTYDKEKESCRLYNSVPSGSKRDVNHKHFSSGKAIHAAAKNLRFCKVCQKPPNFLELASGLSTMLKNQ